MKKTMQVQFAIEVDIDTLPFPEPLPIPELLEDHDLKSRAVAALMQGADLTAILRYVIFRNAGLFEKLAGSLRVPTPSMLQAAADQAGDHGLVAYLAREGDYPPPEGEPARLLEDALSRFVMKSATVTQTTVRNTPPL